MTPPLPPSWMSVMGDIFNTSTMKNIKTFLVKEMKTQVIYPPSKDIFNALTASDFEDVKVVILGQDPYHGAKQAHGLCFSVNKGIKPPPSLVNIFKELKADLGIDPPPHGDLSHWAKQGVLLLNSVLTVRDGQPQSHAGKGWEEFTDRVISELGSQRENLVFILWGSSAQKKAAHIDDKRHLILKAPHPSPLSAHRGFMGCKHFSLTNFFLESHGISPINWALPA